MFIRLVSVSDQMQLPDFHDVFRAILGWRGNLGRCCSSAALRQSPIRLVRC